jgi:hypothetical protein
MLRYIHNSSWFRRLFRFRQPARETTYVNGTSTVAAGSDAYSDSDNQREKLLCYGTSTVAAGSDAYSDSDNQNEKLLILFLSPQWQRLSEYDKISFIKPQISEAYSQLLVVNS